MLKIIFLMLFTFTTAFANDIDKAIKYYNSNDYENAEKVLNNLILKTKDPIQTPKAIVILTKIYITQDKLRNAEFLVRIFNDNYSNSDQKYNMALLSSQISNNKKNSDVAFLKLVELLKVCKNPYININALALLEEIGTKSENLTLTTLKEVVNTTKTYPDIHSVITYSIAVQAYKQNDFNSTTTMLQQYVDIYSNYKFYNDAKKLLNDVETRDYSETIIAVLLPLTGKYSAYGKDVLKGIQLQLKMAGLSNSIKVFDNESDPVVTIEKMREIVTNKSIKAVIGPVSSNNVIAAAAIASLYNTPMITPTATDDGIADIGNNIYQLNLTIQQLAQKIANFSVDSLKYKTFLIIAPTNSYGKKQAREFEKTVTSKGARVIKTQFYSPSQQDFKSEMNSIRRVLLTEQYEEKNFKNGKFDKVDLSKYDQNKLKDENVKVDGIFLPATNSDELIMLIPQILYYRIYGNLLGSSSWYSNSIITDAKDYIKNSYFSLFFYKMDRFTKRLEFENEFEKAYGEKPSKVSYLGFDASDIITNSINKGLNSAVSINNDLSKLTMYQGVSGMINFSNNSGANSEAEIIKIENNRFNKLAK